MLQGSSFGGFLVDCTRFPDTLLQICTRVNFTRPKNTSAPGGWPGAGEKSLPCGG
jgi:hypothetical protein